MKKFLFLLFFLFPVFLFAVIGQNGISIAPDGTLLKWEEGAWDFFIMHKSVLERSAEHIAEISDDGSGAVINDTANPQADTLVDPAVGTTYTLTSKHIPPDADVSRAFLIWLADVDPYKLDEQTKNSVTLTFTNAADPSLTYSQEVKAGFQGNLAKDNKGMFEYEAVRDSVATQLNKEPYCPGETAGYTGYYTYRVEVSDFMKKIIAMGEEKGMQPGEALYGDYNVKGIESSNHCLYMKQSSMAGGWALPFVYTSAHIRAKKIYFYHGLEVYQAKNAFITVNGFELPEDAVIRLGLVVFEGDPGRARVGNGITTFPPEGLSISGFAAPNDYKILFNNCNPPKTDPINYTEIYNSISSIFGWQDETETCIGNPDNPLDPENPIEYAIDADTFLVDSRFSPFDTMFNKGDMQFGLKIGANQDQILTNFLVVSVDTRPPQFDIPENRFTPNGREKDSCSCAKEADAVCMDRPFYYTIKVQNWGEDTASGVMLQDKLPPQVDYVPGSTEIATKINEEGLGTDWETVPDVNGKFPFEEPRVVADMLEHCRQSDSVCEQSAWIRFVVKPKENLAKNEVIKNMAFISSNETAGAVFNTNSSIPLRLKGGTCPAISECELPPKAQCGGVKVEGNDNYCTKDEECGNGKKCIDNECKDDASASLSKGTEVTFGEGVNSPSNDGSAILIDSPSEGVVLGQFYLAADGSEGKFYKFNKLMVKFKADSDIKAENFKLYKDNNSDGKVNDGDTEIASADSISSSYVTFNVGEANRLLSAKGKVNFIVTADASTNSDSRPGKFSMTIEGSESFELADSEKIEAKGNQILFVEYMFEPKEGFIITKGSNTPEVPAYKDFNGEHEMLQVRTKSKGVADAVNSITLKTPNNYVKFGEGIKSVSVIIDKDKNGRHSNGDEVIAQISDFDGSSTVVIDNLGDLLKYEKDEEKFLVFKVEFKMSVGEKAKIQVSGVKVKSGNPVVELPVSSNEFAYECDSSDPNMCDDDDSDGCAISELPEDNSPALYVILALLASILAFAFVKVYGLKK
ncbi:DUF11 domain-containing protein [bacterium]|nr:DUF11 domain-containing protein [bacterium]MBQ4439045.1 DUF11 domain-containing protein [bacterium]